MNININEQKSMINACCKMYTNILIYDFINSKQAWSKINLFYFSIGLLQKPYECLAKWLTYTFLIH